MVLKEIDTLSGISLTVYVQLICRSFHRCLHSTGPPTSHCTSCREGVSLNAQLADLQEAKSSSWSTHVNICSAAMINLYPDQRVVFSLILFFLDVSYILLLALIFIQPSSSLFLCHSHPFLSCFFPHCYPGFSCFQYPFSK